MSETYLQRQVEARQQTWHAAKALLDSAAAENRDLTGEEEQSYQRMTADLDRRAQIIKDLTAAVETERTIGEARELAPEVRETRAAGENADDILRRIGLGEIRGHEFMPERRDVTKSATGSPLPVTFFDQVLYRARLVGPMLRPDVVTVLNTTSGENITIPRINAYSTGTLTAEAAAAGESDPTFLAMSTLSAYKYSFLVQVSNELFNDSGISITDFIATQAGNALGFAVNDVLTTGDGSSKPQGVAAAAGTTLSGTVSTYIPSADEVVDLLYRLDGAARLLPGVAWMARGSQIANLRKLKDNSGQYVYQPSFILGQPDSLLGYPLIENPAVAAAGSAARSLIVGHMPSYYVRTVGGIQVRASEEYAFNQDLVTFRCQIRVDGQLPQTTHVAAFIGTAA